MSKKIKKQRVHILQHSSYKDNNKTKEKKKDKTLFKKKMSEAIKEEVNGLVDSSKEFAQNAIMFVRKCTKPDKKGMYTLQLNDSY
jgi:hypothetical protein